MVAAVISRTAIPSAKPRFPVELWDDLTTAIDAGYIPKERHRESDAMAVSAIRLVNGYVRATKNLKMSAAIKTDRQQADMAARILAYGVSIFSFRSPFF
jgi:hypothetical protein